MLFFLNFFRQNENEQDIVFFLFKMFLQSFPNDCLYLRDNKIEI